MRKCVSSAALIYSFNIKGRWARPALDNLETEFTLALGKKNQKATICTLVTLPPEIIGSLQLCLQDARERRHQQCLRDSDGKRLAHVGKSGI